jgi:hypothetical protein
MVRMTWPRPSPRVAPLLAALVLAGCNGGTVDKEALTSDAETIGSIATEGELLAHDVSKGASTKYFARVQSDNLRREASNLEDALGSRPTSPGLEPKVRNASRLAGRVAEQLNRLHHHPTDRGVASSVEEKLGDLSDQADELAS